MHQNGVTIPELILFGGTRVALGAGIGLLLSNKIGADARRGAGIALVAVGALTTIPLVAELRGKLARPEWKKAA